MSKRFNVKTCHVCGEIEFEDKMLEYNDRWFCGLIHKLQQERKDNESLTNTDRAQLLTFGQYLSRK
jgi:formylmethanofuran dehydrogenase subunit E